MPLQLYANRLDPCLTAVLTNLLSYAKDAGESYMNNKDSVGLVTSTYANDQRRAFAHYYSLVLPLLDCVRLTSLSEELQSLYDGVMTLKEVIL